LIGSGSSGCASGTIWKQIVTLPAGGQIGKANRTKVFDVGAFRRFNNENKTMLVVQVEKPENATLAGWFSELRAWFDDNHCEPLGFTRSGRRIDRVIYQASFHDSVKARQFSSAFAKYAPTVRRATPIERSELMATGAPRG
jgi:hypothetical protein